MTTLVWGAAKAQIHSYKICRHVTEASIKETSKRLEAFHSLISVNITVIRSNSSWKILLNIQYSLMTR